MANRGSVRQASAKRTLRKAPPTQLGKVRYAFAGNGAASQNIGSSRNFLRIQEIPDVTLTRRWPKLPAASLYAQYLSPILAESCPDGVHAHARIPQLQHGHRTRRRSLSRRTPCKLKCGILTARRIIKTMPANGPRRRLRKWDRPSRLTDGANRLWWTCEEVIVIGHLRRAAGKSIGLTAVPGSCGQRPDAAADPRLAPG